MVHFKRTGRGRPPSAGLCRGRAARLLRRLCGTASTAALAVALSACSPPSPPAIPLLHWYVFNEPSGAFARAARNCGRMSGGEYRIGIVPLPADADEQREQLVRRLAAGDRDIDLVGMDVIWTAEFAAAGWIVPWSDAYAARVTGRLAPTLRTARWNGRLWAAPFTTNAQMLWYRSDRVAKPPVTWNQMLRDAQAIGPKGTIQAQGARYEGLTVLFISLLRSAGGRLLTPSGRNVSLAAAPTRRVLELMKRYATSAAAPADLANAHEDQARRGFETGNSSFMLNYSFVWPSAQQDAPAVARHMAWARWPRVDADRPSRVALGGLNIGIGAASRYPRRDYRAALCLTSAANQRLAARLGGLPPTLESLYDDPAVRKAFPFADTLRATLRDAVERPQTPLYSDVSLAVSHTLHPMRDIDPPRTAARLRETVERALHSEGLL